MDLPFATQYSDNWRMEEVPFGLLGDTVALPISNGDRNKITQALRAEHGAQNTARRLKKAEQFIEANREPPQS